MRIAVNISGSINITGTQHDDFTAEIINRVISLHTGHEFILISDKEFADKNSLGENCIRVFAGPKGKNLITWKWWYDVRLSSVLKKHKAELLINFDGYCSLLARIPQLIIVSDLSFLSFPGHFKKYQINFLKRNTPKFLQKSKSIVTTSGLIKNELIKNYGTANEKINIIYGAANAIFKPVSDDKKILIKEKITGGKEYFLYAGDIHPSKNLNNLLKAFSIFKKTQQSNMKLVIAGNIDSGYKSFNENLKTYKYRNDVVIKNDITENECCEIMAAAYAFISPSFYEGTGTAVLDPMQCHVPAIVASGSAMQEIAGEAALYINPENIPDIAAQMMTIYKDEVLRNRLIEDGKLIAAKYKWETSAELLWQSIENAMA